MNKKVVKRGLFPYLFLAVFLFCMYLLVGTMNTKVNELTYGEFMEAVEDKEIKEINVVPNSQSSVYIIRGKLKDYAENETFSFNMPMTNETMVKLLDAEDKAGFKLTTSTDPSSSPFLLFLINILPMVIIVGVGFYLITKQMGSGSKSMDFGRSKARLSGGETKVTFKDVAGLEEEKEEMSELIDFLKNPKKFQKMGARIPKGVLLVGPPGTGKTLLAKAVAGEANVPFYFISGSEFVELFVGVGASRVRDMFKQAKQSAPCLVFIDEIDAVGRQRGAGLGGGHDEREQTLNQLLTEMDGFGANEGIIIIAATNRPDVLDPALLRSGRFDRRVTVNLPDIKGREEILQVHARNKKLASDVSLENLARRTPGFSGADLANVLNEGAILAVRNKETQITMNDLDEAIDRVMMGPAKKSKKYTEKDKLLVAYHEAGHAVIGLKLEDADMVQKVTIIPRGEAGGYNLMTPREEKYFHRKSEFLAKITGLLGGRTSEELVFGEISAGAVNDIEQLTKIAKNMVRVYGMSSLGPIQYADPQGNVFLGRDYTQGGNYSNGVAAEIDKEVRKIIDECHENCRKILEENRDLLDLIAKSLVERETLTNEEITNLMNYGQITNPNEPVEVQEPKEVEVKEPVETEVPPKPPVGVEKQDLDDALNELTKKKD